MKYYNVFILCVIVFAAAYAIGARSFHPAVMVEHVYPQDDQTECNSKGGSLVVTDGNANCTKTTQIFSRTLNNPYIKFIDSKAVNN